MAGLQLRCFRERPPDGLGRLDVPRRTGKIWQIGSPASKRTVTLGRVNRQFIVKVATVQSVSTTPVSAAMPSLGSFSGPVTIRSTPASVRNRQGT